MSMCLDNFFVNKVPFLITLSLRIYFTSVLNLKNWKMTSVVAMARLIYVLCFQRGFRTMEPLIYPKVKVLAPLLCSMMGAPRINVRSTNEHASPVERRIRVAKERC